MAEWLRTQWGAAGRASLSDDDAYFDSDDEAEVQGASLIAGPLGCGKTRVGARGGPTGRVFRADHGARRLGARERAPEALQGGDVV